jgi:hypothetical protein
MPSRKLKHYDRIIQSLEQYAKAIKLKIIRRSENSEGTYVPLRKIIYLDKDLDESEEVAVLLHELGHAHDLAMLGHKEFMRTIDPAFDAANAGNATTEDMYIILCCESRAWEYGEALAKTLGIRLGKWFHNYKQECLDAHRNDK